MTSTEELGQEIASLSAHIDAATHRMLVCIRRFDEAGGWHDQGAASCAHWLAWRVGLDAGTAREKVRVARALGELPAIDKAFSSAVLSYAKVRALTRVATPENEDRLLEMALVATAAQLERLCRGYRAAVGSEIEPVAEERSVHRRLLPGGMVKLELVLEPDEAELILRAVQRAQEVPREQSAEIEGVSAEPPWPTGADGAVRLAESYIAGHPARGTGGERFQVMVHLEQAELAADGRWAATLEDGTGISAETLRRVACDCGLLATGGGGENLNIGRRSRSIPPAIRRALMVRDRGCAFPGCLHTRFLHGHHIKHWLHGGETKVDNVVLLCSFHHHLVHEGGWTVSRGGVCNDVHNDTCSGVYNADGGFLFHSPRGEPLEQVPPPEPVEDILEWTREWADESNLDLGPDVNMPQWDGTKPDYDLAVSCLLEA